MNNRNNVVRVLISQELLIEMLSTGWHSPKDGWIECTDGLPPDAKLIGSGFDPVFPPIGYLVFSHPSFPETSPQETAPIKKVLYTRFTNEKETD